MSKKGDFLSGFSGGSGQPSITDQPRTNVVDMKNRYATEDAQWTTPTNNTSTRTAQRSSAIIKAPEHATAKDNEFHKRKIFQYAVIGVVVIALIIGVIFLVRMLTRVEVPDVTGDELSSVQAWGMTSDIGIESTRMYSLEVPEDHIISQSHEPGTNIPSGSVLAVVVSAGPDMNEVITLPDNLEDMTRAEITTWRNQYGFTATSIAFSDEASSEVENNHVIRIEVPNDVDINHFTRSDRLTIVFSSGPEIVQMGNFMAAPNNTREAVETWANENPGIDVEIEYEANENVERDIVLRQSAAPNANLAEGDAVTIVLSGGSPIIVPNFAEIPRAYFEELGQELGLMINARTVYSDTIGLGRFISQSIAAGEELFGESPSVTVIHSEGRPWIDRIGMENGIAQAIDGIEGFNSRGAAITFNVFHINHYEDRGTVVFQSLYDQYVALNAHIIFHISLGNLERPEEDESANGGSPNGEENGYNGEEEDGDDHDGRSNGNEDDSGNNTNGDEDFGDEDGF